MKKTEEKEQGTKVSEETQVLKEVEETQTPQIQEKIEEQQKIIDDYTNTLKHLQADFENYVKRIEKEKQHLTEYANHKIISKLLNVADDFEKALEVMKDKNDEITKGIEMMHKNFHKLLHEEGVKPIHAMGNKLDPYKHEVIDIVEGKEDDIVVGELQKGYMIKEKVLRPSKVRISKAGGK